MKNKAKLRVLALAILGMTISGCDNTEPENTGAEITTDVTSIKLNKSVISLFYNDNANDAFNEEFQLVATALPKKAGTRKFNWSSSDPSVVTVDENGKIKAVGEGFSDITVSNKDGSVTAKSHIVVNNMNGTKISHASSRYNDIVATQKKDGFKVPDVIASCEAFDKVTMKNGVVINRDKFYQTITVSEEQAFIQLDVDEYVWKCEDGTVENTSMQYVFYTTDSYETYLFKSQGNTNNYLSANQSDYIGKGKLEALKAVCNNFFVAGESIMTEPYSDIQAQGLSSWFSSAEKNEHFGRMEKVPGQLAFDIREAYTQYASSEDEDDLNIPVGTQYTMEVYDRILFENYFVTNKSIEEVYSWKDGEDDYKINLSVDYTYNTDVEIKIPNKDGYLKVESISDL